MNDVLYLVHRIPYPPVKGDKITSYNLLKYLCGEYRVHLGAFVDDPEDLPHGKLLADMAQGETRFAPIHPKLARLKSLAGLITGEALSVRYYHDRSFQAWVDGVIDRHRVQRIVAFSGAMAQFVGSHRGSGMRRVLNFQDVDSDKWRQFAQTKPWPMNWIFRREARVLLDFEKRMAAEAESSAFVSSHEAELFKSLAPESAHKVSFIENGVDQDYFDPGLSYPNPYPAGSEALVFTGAMDYWANVDAVEWFAREVFPAILRQKPSASFYIVGSKPHDRVTALASLPSVHVTGRVADVRPYLAHGRLAVAPMRIARGIQNKVLEAMAMAKPVVATSAGFEGIDRFPGLEELACDTPEAFALAVLRLLSMDNPEQIGNAGRGFILDRYNWNRNQSRIKTLLEEGRC